MSKSRRLSLLGSLVLALFFAENSIALDLEWSGQFRAESHMIYNYSLSSGNLNHDTNKSGQNGYYIPGGGEKNAFFQSLFMRLKPIVVVNDNIYLKSEWNVGDPIYGVFGGGAPQGDDGRAHYSTMTRGSSITAGRYWGEFLSEVGTFQVGRAPLHWGLGVIWNSGDGVFDRYQSTGDVVRLVSKFGSFTFMPAIIKYSIGNNIGGACVDPAVGCTDTQSGLGGLTDYSLAFKYENLDEDVEMGLNFIRRIAGGAQDPNFGYLGPDGNTAGMNYNTWAIYGKKKLGDITLGVELPVVSGSLGPYEYRTYALALEGDWRINDMWEMGLKAGHAPGQPDTLDNTSGVYKALYYHNNYNVALIMFNYQFANFYGRNNYNNPNLNNTTTSTDFTNQTTSTTTSTSLNRSPYDNPIVNANYLAWTGRLKTTKWHFRTSFIIAKANETAGPGTFFFNHWKRRYVARAQSTPNQPNELGWEMDYGTTFFWDDAFQFHLDFGFWFPGDYYKFTNVTDDFPDNSAVFAVNFKAGVVF